MIATGARSILPELPFNCSNVSTLKDMNDGIKLKELMSDENVKNVTIMGTGFIGLETIEAAKELGKTVHIIGRSGRILSKTFDKEITDLLEEELRNKGVHLHLEEKIQEFVGKDKVTKVITDKCEIDTDLVVIAIGVKPNTDFLKNTNIEMLSNGAIIVDGQGKTSVEDVYSAGDCASIKSIINNDDLYVPLATGANKLGRIVGENLAGLNSSYPGSLASACIKVLDMEAGVTGLTEEKAKALNLNYGTAFIDRKSVV